MMAPHAGLCSAVTFHNSLYNSLIMNWNKVSSSNDSFNRLSNTAQHIYKHCDKLDYD
jgi:hypothetical protein